MEVQKCQLDWPTMLDEITLAETCDTPLLQPKTIFIWRVDLRVYSCKGRIYLPLALFFINFVLDCITGYITSKSRKMRFTNIIIAILWLLLLLLISSSSSSSSSSLLWLAAYTLCWINQSKQNNFFWPGHWHVPLYITCWIDFSERHSSQFQLNIKVSSTVLSLLSLFHFHLFVAFQNRALCHIQGLGAYFVSACASNFITNFRTFKEIFNSLTHSPSYITASLTFEAVGEILWCYQSKGTSLEELLRGAMCRIWQKKFGNFVNFWEFVYIYPYKE